eukprot:TRINITY_DN1939_c0_g1_i2.p1 TRINITY_DN1939_c0_g1~~TRINITY_DN1939_c0_g1_i2.p1  ORF type:complete len:533 (-),score=139.51 TRINITY_DN1939_c0_g1_i2:230-1828(-)
MDAAVVYVRLSNFAARRRRLQSRLRDAEEESPMSPYREPLTPYLRPNAEESPQRPDELHRRERRAATAIVRRSLSSESRTSPSRPRTPQALSPQVTLSDAALDLRDIGVENSFALPPGHEAASDENQDVTSRLDHPDVTSVSDGEPELEADQEKEAAHIASIQKHLEGMNAAASELNVLQSSLNQCIKRRRSLVQLWAVGSARLARAVGAPQIAKATPYYEAKRRCKVAQDAVQSISNRFMVAKQDDMVELAEEHMKCLKEYQAATEELAKEGSKKSAPTASMIAAVAPYFEAEDEHRITLKEEDAEVEELQERVNEAKLRYKGELRSLEALSNQAHSRRAAKGDISTETARSAAGETPPWKGSAGPASLPVQRRGYEDGRAMHSRSLAPARLNFSQRRTCRSNSGLSSQSDDKFQNQETAITQQDGDAEALHGLPETPTATLATATATPTATTTIATATATPTAVTPRSPALDQDPNMLSVNESLSSSTSATGTVEAVATETATEIATETATETATEAATALATEIATAGA